MTETPNPVDPAEKKLPPETEVGAFVTGLWEHPLRDKPTKDLRASWKTHIEDALNLQGISPDTYVATPFGSIMRIATEQSDYDFDLIVARPTDEAIANNLQLITLDDRTHRLKKILLKQALIRNKLESWEMEFEDSIYYPQSHIIFSLFITPDEYIAGNKDLAKQMRLKAVTFMSGLSPEDTEEFWDNNDSYTKTIYKEMYKYWEQHDLEKINPLPDYVPVLERFNRNLELRAQQEPDPEAWKAKYLAERDARQLPSFDTYRQALQATGGAIKILPDYIERGIQE